MFTKLREPVCGLTHLFGALLSLVGLYLLVSLAASAGKIDHLIVFAIFGLSLIALYTASALYHLLPLGERSLRALRRVDHLMIYVLIAGTYTPVCVIALQGVWGWSLLSAIWALSIGGIVLRLTWLNTPRWLRVLIYVIMGWLGVFAFGPLLQSMPVGGIIWLLLGGVFYTGGALIYSLRRPNILPGVFGYHEIWHLFVMAGSFSHFMMMIGYISYLG